MSSPVSPSDFLTVREAARELKSGTRPIYAAINRGQLKAAAINDRGDLRIAREWLATYVENLSERAHE